LWLLLLLFLSGQPLERTGLGRRSADYEERSSQPRSGENAPASKPIPS
jgi:hypothetical protein